MQLPPDANLELLRASVARKTGISMLQVTRGCGYGVWSVAMGVSKILQLSAKPRLSFNLSSCAHVQWHFF